MDWSLWRRLDCSFREFSSVENWSKAWAKILAIWFHWRPRQPHSDCTTVCIRKIIGFCHFITESVVFCSKTINKLKTYRKSFKENEAVTSDSSNDSSTPETNIFVWFKNVHKLPQKSRFTDYIKHFLLKHKWRIRKLGLHGWDSGSGALLLSWLRLQLRLLFVFTN